MTRISPLWQSTPVSPTPAAGADVILNGRAILQEVPSRAAVLQEVPYTSPIAGHPPLGCLADLHVASQSDGYRTTLVNAIPLTDAGADTASPRDHAATRLTCAAGTAMPPWSAGIG